MQQSLPENPPGISPSLHHFLERGLVWRLLAGHLRRAGSLRRPAAPDAGHPPCDLSAESGRPVCIGAPSSGRSCGARPSCTSEPSGSLESRGANWVRAPRRPSAGWGGVLGPRARGTDLRGPTRDPVCVVMASLPTVSFPLQAGRHIAVDKGRARLSERSADHSHPDPA